MVALWSMSPVTLSRSGKLRHVLKKSLWNDHDIAGLKSHVARNVTVSYQIREMNRVGILLAVNGANDNGVISCGVSGKTADGDHRIEHRHIGAIRQRTRLGSLADNTHLVGDRTDEILYDDRDQRLLDVFREPLFVFARKSSRRLADRHDVFDERDRDAAIRPHRHGNRQLGVAPNEDVQAVARTDAIFRRRE